MKRNLEIQKLFEAQRKSKSKKTKCFDHAILLLGVKDNKISIKSSKIAS